MNAESVPSSRHATIVWLPDDQRFRLTRSYVILVLRDLGTAEIPADLGICQSRCGGVLSTTHAHRHGESSGPVEI